MQATKTRWMCPPQWEKRPDSADLNARSSDWSASDLVTLVRQSLGRGHHKVAAQRCLMLQAAGASVPDDLVYLLTDVLGSLSRAERSRISRTADAWARMIVSKQMS